MATRFRAEAGANVRSLSRPWRAALDELIRASMNAESPWGCKGGTVDLIERDGAATLTVTTSDGHTVSRRSGCECEVAFKTMARRTRRIDPRLDERREPLGLQRRHRGSDRARWRRHADRDHLRWPHG